MGRGYQARCLEKRGGGGQVLRPTWTWGLGRRLIPSFFLLGGNRLFGAD